MFNRYEHYMSISYIALIVNMVQMDMKTLSYIIALYETHIVCYLRLKPSFSKNSSGTI